MKPEEIMTLEHAMFWAKQGKRRQVTYEFDMGYWDTDSPSVKVSVNDRAKDVYGQLPMPFVGDIDKLLCERQQEKINDQIVRLVSRLEKSKEGC